MSYVISINSSQFWYMYLFSTLHQWFIAYILQIPMHGS